MVLQYDYSNSTAIKEAIGKGKRRGVGWGVGWEEEEAPAYGRADNKAGEGGDGAVVAAARAQPGLQGLHQELQDRVT